MNSRNQWCSACKFFLLDFTVRTKSQYIPWTVVVWVRPRDGDCMLVIKHKFNEVGVASYPHSLCFESCWRLETKDFNHGIWPREAFWPLLFRELASNPTSSACSSDYAPRCSFTNMPWLFNGVVWWFITTNGLLPPPIFQNHHINVYQLYIYVWMRVFISAECAGTARSEWEHHNSWEKDIMVTFFSPPNLILACFGRKKTLNKKTLDKHAFGFVLSLVAPISSMIHHLNEAKSKWIFR